MAVMTGRATPARLASRAGSSSSTDWHSATNASARRWVGVAPAVASCRVRCGVLLAVDAVLDDAEGVAGDLGRLGVEEPVEVAAALEALGQVDAVDSYSPSTSASWPSGSAWAAK